MSWEVFFVFGLLLLTLGLLLWEYFSPDIVALMALSLLLVTGILGPSEAFQVFSNEAVLTVVSLFVVSAALERTGVIDRLGRSLDRYLGKSDFSFLAVILPCVALVSAFINNTPVVLVLLPIVISLGARRQIKPSKLLIPVSFASIFGGSCTVIGTSTNLLVSSSAVHMGLPPLSMFELAKVGVPLAVAGLLYLLFVGRRWLPERETLSSTLQDVDLKQYLTEVVVEEDSPLVGRNLTDTNLVGIDQARVLDVMRDRSLVTTPLNRLVLRAGDLIRLSSPASAVVEIRNMEGVRMQPQKSPGLEFVGTQKAAVVECLIGPRSSLLGKTVRQANLRNRFGVLILAVHRHGRNLRRKFANVRLQYGDSLLLEGTRASMERLQGSRDFLLLQDVEPPAADRDGWRSLLAIGVISAVVVLAALEVLPIAVLAFSGALVVVIAGCLSSEEAYESIDWQVVMLIYGMLGLGAALEKTGGLEIVAAGLIRALGDLGPKVLLSAVFLGASFMTTFLSNNAVAVLMAPIVLGAAQSLELDPRPFLVAVAVGASACFATPIGYQTNTLVYGAGGYRFWDFVKVGLPLNLLFWILASILIPWFWPLTSTTGQG